jgi:hypothetical protein
VADEPIQERILQDCQTALAAIDGTDPYWYALATVVPRGESLPDSIDRLPAARIAEGVEKVADGPGPLLTRLLAVTVEARLSEKDGLPTKASRLLADLERALTGSEALRRRSDLAVDTTITGSSRELDDTPGTVGDVTLELLVHYRTQQGDPAAAG